MKSHSSARALARAAAAIALVALASLTGCDGSPTMHNSGEYADLSLRETRTPTESLRDQAAGRVPAEVVSAQRDSLDRSVACLSTADDPDGLIRSWQSSIDVAITEEPDLDISALVGDLADSFVAEGWTARALGGNATVTSQLLDSDENLADLQITGLSPDPDQASTNVEEFVTETTVRIQVYGPCVRTAGPDSDEVKVLEKE